MPIVLKTVSLMMERRFQDFALKRKWNVVIKVEPCIPISNSITDGSVQSQIW